MGTIVGLGWVSSISIGPEDVWGSNSALLAWKALAAGKVYPVHAWATTNKAY